MKFHSYSGSLHYDRRLYWHDIAGSVVHVRMLARQKIIKENEAEDIIVGLNAILEEIQGGHFPWRDDLEDIHMNIETRLYEKVGTVAGKLHTARSRNDQVATDMRLYAKEAIKETIKNLRDLQGALVECAEAHDETIMPGYTHLQRAQPVLLAHHLLAYFQMLQRDALRFERAYVAADVLPLGSGALAGVPYDIDRVYVANQLGFSSISENSLDAVSDRDFLLDYQYAAAACIMHISRLAEEIVLWSSAEFGFVRLADDYTTGSSMMPQKRNPDFAELARGKTGRVYGHLIGLLTLLKGLPLSYNRDLQEDKEGFFDTADTIIATLGVLRGMLKSVEFNTEQMRYAVEQSQSLATDLADYLVQRGIPFREAHGVVSRLTRYAVDQGKLLLELSLEEYQEFSPAFDSEVYRIDIKASVNARDVKGGTSPRQVKEAIAEAKKSMEAPFAP